MTINLEPVAAADRSPDTKDVQRTMQIVHDPKISPIDKYIYLRNQQSRNPNVFYRGLVSHCEEMLPYLYTPTVGEACQRYHALPIPTYGLYLRATNSGNFLSMMRSLPQQDIQVVVVTDGERILGLGDLGAGGMGISEGKSLLYTAAAGVDPSAILPVCIDVGTANPSLLNDPSYKGLRQPRLTGAAYEAVIEEFISALKTWRPNAVLQFEDFGNHTAFQLLLKYRKRICCFNDDIQGTACITLAGLLSALRAEGTSLKDQRVLFLGAGEAGTGIGELIAIALEMKHGMTREEGRKHCYFIDSKGLVCASRTNLQSHKRAFAHDVPNCETLEEAVATLQPTVLIGVSTSRGAFTPEIMRTMAKMNTRPIIFPLSNPTSKSECTFQEAFNATDGRVLFASGSPFPSITHQGKTYTPAQANNAYVFPAIGHAAALCNAKEITDGVFLLAAEALAGMTARENLEHGMLFPRFSNIRTVSCALMAAIADDMCASGLGSVPVDFESVVGKMTGQQGKLSSLSRRAKWEAYTKAHMYDPNTTTAPRL